MKKIIACLMILCIVFCFCACGKKETAAETEKINIKTVENENCKKIAETLGTMKIDEVLADIKNIDLYSEPDISEKDYTVKTAGNNETNYYSGNSLVCTVYDSDYKQEFANYTRTASGLDAKVTYYVDSGDNRSVCVETDKYRIFANTLDKNDICGLGGTDVVIYSENTKAPFESTVNYYYENGTATFGNAVYLENGSYQRYRFGVNQDENETEYTDVLVSGKTPETSDGIIKVLLSDRSYKYAAIQIRCGNKWYTSDDKWYAETELAIVMDNEKQAEEFIRNNNLNGTVENYGSVIVKIDNAVLPIDKNAVLEDGKLPPFITGESDDTFFNKITFDGSGVITEMTRSDLACY